MYDRAKTLVISAKHSGLCTATLLTGELEIIGAYKGGLLPNMLPGVPRSDYIDLEIDIETGTIKNWKKPTPQQLKAIFTGEEE